MATNILPINALTIRATAVSDTNRLKTSTSATVNGGANAKWWSPLFGWPADANYIDNVNSSKDAGVERSSEIIPAKSTTKFTPGCFTEEKAKMLRLRTKESFHDVMYHSVIASRLASDFSDRD